MDIVGVVLAGGEGRRFGGDKLIALVDGEPSVTRVAATLRVAGARLVYVITRSVDRCKLYSALAGIDGCLYDAPIGCRGPGAALAAISELGARTVLVAPGDAPWLSPSVYTGLMGFVDGCDAAAPLHGSGFVETLVMILRERLVEEARSIAERLCRARGDVRPSDYLRVARCAVLVGSSLLGVLSPSSFAHINTRDAVRTRAARNPLGDKVVIELRGGALRELLNGSRRSCELLAREAESYKEAGIIHLARHAVRDLEYFCGEERSQG